MKKLLPLLFVIATSLSACYGNQLIEVEGVFLCNDNMPCLDSFECRKVTEDEKSKKEVFENLDPNQTYCFLKQEEKPSKCIDRDGDGYGGSENTPRQLASCPKCTGQSCPVDCNDSDKNINPGAPELFCNNKDDNCNGKVDEVVNCKKFTDCPTVSDLQKSCESNVCAYAFATASDCSVLCSANSELSTKPLAGTSTTQSECDGLLNSFKSN